MSAVSKDYAALAASTSTLLESSMMEGDELYDPTTVPIANEEWSKKGGTSNLCRLCANTSDYFIPIFEGEGLEHELSEKIDKHLPIKVCDSDSLPIHVCYQCASTLIAWHDLLLNCVEAEKKLLQIQQQVEQDDLEESKNIEFDAAPSMDSDNAEDSVEATTPLVTPEEMEKSAPSTSKKNTSIKERPSLKRPLAKKSASSQKKARKTETEISPVGPEDGPAEEETVIGRFRAALPHAPLKVSHQANVKVNDVPPLLVKTEGEEEQLKELCSHCGATFLHKSELATHITKDHSFNMFHCEMCDKILKNRKSFVVHIRAHGGSLVPHLSSTAGFKSCRVQKALSHTLMLGKDLPQTDFVCSVCLKRFKTEISLKKHESLHDALKNVTEDVEIKEEKQRQKANPNVLYSCDKCGKRFGMKISFLKHMRHHTGEKPYTCHICGKQFTHTGGLYYHLKHVHAGIKNHACDICGRPFALKAALEDHRRIHTGERPFVCHFCGKSFKSKASLYIHNKIHSNSFPHSCTYCDKRFRWRQQLLAHLTTHTGEKNHICDVCGRGFGVKNDLTRHKYCHSEVKPHECTVCGISFGQRRYLRNHLKTRHDLPEPVALIVV